ncbi:hypothetical protein ACFSZS_22495 [Seohaeicola zhoushanensis]
MIAAIYETVIRPELFDAFMDAWDSHIQAAIAERVEPNQDRLPDSIEIDPELSAHFVRAYEILEQLGRRAVPGHPLDRIARAEGFSLALTPMGQVLAASRVARDMLGEAGSVEALRAELTGTSAEVLAQLQRAAQEGARDLTPVVLATALAPRHLMARLEEGWAARAWHW